MTSMWYQSHRHSCHACWQTATHHHHKAKRQGQLQLIPGCCSPKMLAPFNWLPSSCPPFHLFFLWETGSRGWKNHRKSLIQSYQQSELHKFTFIKKKAPNSQLGEIEKTWCWRSNMVTRQPLVKNAQKSDILSHFPTICEAPTVVFFFLHENGLLS